MRAILLMLLFAGDLACAQNVFKCQGPDGRVTYQNTPCTGAASGAQMKGGRVQDKPAAAPIAPKAAPAQPSAGARCYEDSDVRELEVRLANAATPPEVKSFLGTEQRRLLACDYTGLTADERARRAEAVRDLGSADPSKREAAMNAINGLYLQKRRQAEKGGR